MPQALAAHMPLVQCSPDSVQSAHAPLVPQLWSFALPSVHWPRVVQQYPEPHVPSFGLPHALVQPPPLHVGVTPLQEEHVPPLWPHASLPSPEEHVLPSQHPPLQGEFALHAVPQRPLMQACPCGQSLGPPQPPGPSNGPTASCGAKPSVGPPVSDVASNRASAPPPSRTMDTLLVPPQPAASEAAITTPNAPA